MKKKPSIPTGLSGSLSGRLQAPCLTGCCCPQATSIKRTSWLWLQRAMKLLSRRTLSVTPMCLNFWGCRRTSLPLVSFCAATRTVLLPSMLWVVYPNNIFASRYVLYMPNKDQLIAQVENVLKKWHKDDSNEGPL